MKLQMYMIKNLYDNNLPYPTKGAATGLAFDCGNGITPSMQRIFDAYNEQYPNNFATDLMDGVLDRWADEGVFLLNTALTVRAGQPGSHLKQWYPFTMDVLGALNRRTQEPYNLPPPVYLLWGKMAQEYETILDDIAPRIKTEHPIAGVYATPKRKKWIHGDCFHKANEELIKLKVEPIDW